jgi:hypothetical protein
MDIGKKKEIEHREVESSSSHPLMNATELEMDSDVKRKMRVLITETQYMSLESSAVIQLHGRENQSILTSIDRNNY